MKKGFSTIIYSGVTISILTAFIYLASYFYTKGFYDVYGFDSSFIMVQISTMINVSSMYAGLIFVIGISIYFAFRVARKTKNKLISVPIPITYFCIITILTLVTYKVNIAFIFIPIGILIVAWLPFIISCIKRRVRGAPARKTSDSEKFFAFVFHAFSSKEVKEDIHDDVDNKHQQNSGVQKSNTILKTIFLLSVCVYLTILIFGNIFFAIGRVDGIIESDYYYATDFDNAVIVYHDPDKFILMPFDEEQNAFDKAYTIVGVDNIGTIEPVELSQVSLPNANVKESIKDFLLRLIR